VAAIMLGLTLAAGCTEGSGTLERPDDSVIGRDGEKDAEPEVEVVPVGPPMTELRLVGNRIRNADGLDGVLHGANRSGTEYPCVESGGIFDGPSDLAWDRSAHQFWAEKGKESIEVVRLNVGDGNTVPEGV
jgi:hypothetical protein